MTVLLTLGMPLRMSNGLSMGGYAGASGLAASIFAPRMPDLSSIQSMANCTSKSSSEYAPSWKRIALISLSLTSCWLVVFSPKPSRFMLATATRARRPLSLPPISPPMPALTSSWL